MDIAKSTDSKTIGRRIKYFRKRAGISQFDLEVELDASPGSISRIENGRVNPTKETVNKIAETLEMNDNELDYVIGKTAVPATREEINKAIAELGDYFDQNVYAYLIDERWRLWKLSNNFRKMLGVTNEYLEKVFGNATIQFVTDPALGIVNRFDPTHLNEILDNNLRFFYKEVGFMQDDETYIKAVESIRKNPLGRSIWDKISYEKDIKYNFSFGRKAHFKALGKFTIPFTYKYEPLLKNSRFKVVEWTPDNAFLKLLTKLIS